MSRRGGGANNYNTNRSGGGDKPSPRCAGFAVSLTAFWEAVKSSMPDLELLFFHSAGGNQQGRPQSQVMIYHNQYKLDTRCSPLSPVKNRAVTEVKGLIPADRLALLTNR